ncbi:MAG: hypothetical protein HY088_07700 [Ignavibacteriales bacterium]|nr:hypothetical protein [Ignavibacteriales bacterium]
MKSFLFTLAFLAVFVIADSALAQNPSSSGGKKALGEVSVTGEVIDTKCYLTGMMGGKGAEHEACAIACMKGGLPVGILEEKTGKVYILAPEKGTKGANETLLPYAAKTVTVKGKIMEKGGAKVLLYSSVEGK